MRGTFIGAAMGMLGAGGACGGTATVDGPLTTTSTAAGGGGSGGTSTTTTTTATGGGSTTTGTGGAGGTANLCAQLENALQQKLLEALACNAALAVEQCTGAAMVYDQCGCDVAANEHAPTQVAAAIAAYDQWVAAGCGPYDCAYCVPPLPAACVAGSDPSAGMCVSMVN